MNIPEGHAMRPYARFYSRFVGVVAFTDGFAFLLVPSLVDSVAYSWAKTLLPGWAWGIIFLLIGITCLSQQFKPNLYLLRLAASVSIFVYFTFGLSILTLTLQGSIAAITGATKWGAISAMGVFLLKHPMTYPLPTEHDWWAGE